MKRRLLDGIATLILEDGDETIIIEQPEGMLIDGNAEWNVCIGINGHELPPYTGETIVTPKAFQSTTLQTAYKSVYENITVLEIPYNEVSNPSGGTTVSIG